jgi:hypothetical protein
MVLIFSLKAQSILYFHSTFLILHCPRLTEKPNTFDPKRRGFEEVAFFIVPSPFHSANKSAERRLRF